jgi:hypothetical protein
MASMAFDAPAVSLLLELEGQGFTVQLSDSAALLIEPGSTLSIDQRQRLVQLKSDVIALLQAWDLGVCQRREVFAQQIAASDGAIPALVFVPHITYTRGVCFSCSARLPEPKYGRCWRCRLAWRLTVGLDTTSDVRINSGRHIA